MKGAVSVFNEDNEAAGLPAPSRPQTRHFLSPDSGQFRFTSKYLAYSEHTYNVHMQCNICMFINDRRAFSPSDINKIFLLLYKYNVLGIRILHQPSPLHYSRFDTKCSFTINCTVSAKINRTCV